MWHVRLVSVLVLVSYAFAALTSCVPQGNSLICSGTMDYTGPAAGEVVSPTDFTFEGEEYVPLTPISFKLKGGNTDYGAVTCNVSYRMPTPFKSGCNSAANVPPIWGNNSMLNVTQLAQINPLIVDTKMTVADCTGVTSGYFMVYGLCGYTNVILGYIQGTYVGSPSICGVDRTTRRQFVNVEATIGGSTFSYDTDVYNPVAVKGVSLSVPASIGTVYDFLYFDGVSYLGPNANYTAEPLTKAELSRDWIPDPTVGVNWASGAVYFPPIGSVCGGIQYLMGAECGRRRHSCSKLNSAGLLTADKLSPLPSGVAVTNVAGINRLVSLVPSSALSTSVSYSTTFVKAPPKLQITGYSVKCEDNYMIVQYNNSGNVGSVKLKTVFVDGTSQAVNYDVEFGLKSMRVMYSKDLSQICFGSDCTSVLCSKPVSKNNSSDAWFNTSNKGMYAFQVIGIVVMGAVAVVTSFYVLKWSGGAVVRRYQSWRYGKVGTIPMANSSSSRWTKGGKNGNKGV